MAYLTVPPAETVEHASHASHGHDSGHDNAHDHGAITLDGSVPVLIAGVLFCFTCSLVFFYTGLGMMRSISSLGRQLEEFSIKDSKCFCCSNHHRHPDTGETLICDRDLVYDAIRQWYGKDTDEADEHLERFDRAVQTRLRGRVLAGVHTAILPFQTFLYLACALASPPLLEMWAVPLHKPDAVTWWMLFADYSHTWLRHIVEALIVMGIMMRTCFLGSRLLSLMSRLPAALLLAPVGFGGTVLTILAVPSSFQLVAEVSFDLIPLVLLAWFLLAWCLLSGAPFQCMCDRLENSSTSR